MSKDLIQMTIRVDIELYKQISHICIDKGINKNDYIINAIKEYVKNK